MACTVDAHADGLLNALGNFDDLPVASFEFDVVFLS
jgi:hypothetical protein